MAASLDNKQFCLAEFEKIFIGDRVVRSLCSENTKAFVPDGPEAASIISEIILEALRKKEPMSLLRVGDGEGNALGMTHASIHPLVFKAFSAKFKSQNGISITQETAIDFCAKVRSSLVSADIIGFRSFRFNEESTIPTRIEAGRYNVALGILYTRELLQQGLIEGYWRQAVVTSAWIHLDLIPHLAKTIQSADSIIVITGREELREEMRSRLGARLEEFITVPVQRSLPKSLEQSHIFNALPIVLERLNRDLRGKLVLVGAGLFGKLYCHRAKANGAVAVDLGSAFDILAGLKTRPIHEHYDIDAMRWI